MVRSAGVLSCTIDASARPSARLPAIASGENDRAKSTGMQPFSEQDGERCLSGSTKGEISDADDRVRQATNAQDSRVVQLLPDAQHKFERRVHHSPANTRSRM